MGVGRLLEGEQSPRRHRRRLDRIVDHASGIAAAREIPFLAGPLLAPATTDRLCGKQFGERVEE
jgi:hypothetical protein